MKTVRSQQINRFFLKKKIASLPRLTVDLRTVDLRTVDLGKEEQEACKKTEDVSASKQHACGIPMQCL